MCKYCDDEMSPEEKIHHHVNDSVAPENYLRAIKHMHGVLKELGVDLTDENFQNTPQRFVKYLAEFLQPFDAARILSSSFSTHHAEYNGMVVQTKIPFRGVCAHHLLPYIGEAHIGMVPNKSVVGLSKVPRLVKAVGLNTPSIQEKQTDILADLLVKELEPKGVIVVVSAVHTCMAARGVAVPNTPTVTSSVRGVFRDVPAARQEFFELLKANHLA